MKENIRFILTKLMMPLPRKNYIVRERLFSKLDRILEHKVTLVIGTAASGKTTLLSSFIKERRLKNVRWISLDQDNSNLFSFWYYFIEAVKDCYSNKFDEILKYFNEILSKNDIEKLVVMLINYLDINDDIIFVFDDFQHITDPYLSSTIEYFIKNSPDSIRIVLLSREQPKMYLGDLAMHEKLLEIDEKELKFSELEGLNFLENTLKMKFERNVFQEINTAAEGWVGGLQLAALASKNGKFKDIKILNKYMVEYLSNEILESLSEEEQSFLIKTSILSYFDENICNELLDISCSGKIIGDLSDKNLFLINIDETHGIYRYHNIFSEFLILQFEKYNQSTKYNIHLKAAEIFEKLNDFDESMHHLLCIKNYDAAIELIDKYGENSKGWFFLSKIPNEIVLKNKGLTLQKFFYYLCNAELEECKEIVEAAEIRQDYKDIEKVLQLSMALLGVQTLNADSISTEEIEKLKISDTAKALLYLVSSYFMNMSDSLKSSEMVLNKAIAIEKKHENVYIKYFILNSKTQMMERIGKFYEAEAVYSEIFKMIEEYPILEKVKINAYIGIVGIYLKSFQLDKAYEKLKKVYDTIEGSQCDDKMQSNYKGITNDYLWIGSGYLYNLIEYKLLKGEKDGLPDLIKKFASSGKYAQALFSSAVKFSILADNISKEQLERYAAQFENEKTLFNCDKLVYARVLMMLRRQKQALEVINDVLVYSRKNGARNAIVEAVLLKVIILNDAFEINKREIYNLLLEAVNYSYQNEIVEPYVLEGYKIKELLELLKNEKEKDLNSAEIRFIDELLSDINGGHKTELLSAREKEVLKVLAEGATNKEIGDKLCISVSTVKTHIINIYSKLNVSNRVEAAKKAKEAQN